MIGEGALTSCLSSNGYEVLCFDRGRVMAKYQQFLPLTTSGGSRATVRMRRRSRAASTWRDRGHYRNYLIAWSGATRSRKASKTIASFRKIQLFSCGCGQKRQTTTIRFRRMADRRCALSRFQFEDVEWVATSGSEPRSLLTVLAIAPGRCGRGFVHWQEGRAMLARLGNWHLELSRRPQR